MAKLHFSLADPGDDAEVRALLRRNVMQGDIAVTFRREPSYFHAAAVQGRVAEVYKGVDTASGALAGLGGRFRLPAYVNGVCTDIGYLADLRVEAAYRSGLGLRRAYDFLRARHACDPLPYYTTMILQGNQAALKVLAANRAGLPPYRPQGRVHTPMLILGLPKAAIRLPGISISPAQLAEAAEVFAFVNREHARRQFAPHYEAADLHNGRLRGLRMEDIWLARREGVLVGTLALWDQYAFRQIHVEAYGGHWRWLKPLYDGLCRITPLQALPQPGASLRCAYAALAAVADDDAAVFAALLRTLYRHASRGPWHYLTVALHERDPLLPVLSAYRRIDAGGHVFTVEFDAHPPPLDGRVPYVEAGAL